MQSDDQAAGDGKPWGEPLLRADVAWQGLESRLCAAVLIAEIASLTLWVMLRGLATDLIPGGGMGGLVCRSLISMTVLGIAAHLATRKRGGSVHAASVSAAIVFGLVGGSLWVHVGCTWASNLLNWFQNSSVLMLVGGLRGLATRLTLWVALLGASLASSRGKHIHVDVVLRFVPVQLRRATAIVSLLAATVVVTIGAAGFVDYIAIAMFQVNASQNCPDDPAKSCDTPVGEKMASMGKEMSADFFLLGRQASLDIRAFPRVLFGTPYDKWMSGADWNAWLDGADWTAHYPKAAVDAQHVDASVPGSTHMPGVQIPGLGDARGLLSRELDFVFPVGMWVIAIKFIIRILLVMSGHVRIDPESELDDDALTHSHERDAAAAKELPV